MYITNLLLVWSKVSIFLKLQLLFNSKNKASKMFLLFPPRFHANFIPINKPLTLLNCSMAYLSKELLSCPVWYHWGIFCISASQNLFLLVHKIKNKRLIL